MKTLFRLTSLSFLMISIAFNYLSAQPINITGSNGVDGNYFSLTLPGGVFAVLNPSNQTGMNIVVTINADVITETGANSLNSAAGGAWTSLTIRPSGTRIISGNAAAPLIDLNGADNVTINGLNTAVNKLTIANTNPGAVASTSTIRFTQGANFNTVTNCSIQGSFSGPLATDGGNIFFSIDAVTGSGNDSNTISNCNIGPAGADLPTKLIYGNGSLPGTERNEGIVISNNNLFDFFSPTESVSAIHILSGNDKWDISGNRIYQTAARTFSGPLLKYSGISINSNAGTRGQFFISINRIGFGSNVGTGVTSISGSSNQIIAIDIPRVDTINPTSVQGNFISGIVQTTGRSVSGLSNAPFIGIAGGYSGSGMLLIGNILGNQIGTTDGSSSIIVNASSTTLGSGPVLGIFESGNVPSKVSNNHIGNIIINQAAGVGSVTGFTGIFVIGSRHGIATEVKNNLIFDIRDNLIGEYNMVGIFIFRKAGIIFNNTVAYCRGFSVLRGPAMVGLIVNNGAGTNIIEKNDIRFLINTVTTSDPVAVYGYDLQLPATPNEIKQNYCRGLNINASSNECVIIGMEIRPECIATISNNMITLGLDQNGSSITSSFNIIGIQDVNTGPFNKFYYYNSIYITGSGVNAGGFNTFAMNCKADSIRELKNNIFWNGRSNAVPGGGKHYAVSYAGTGPNPPGLTSDYNDLIASGTDGVLGLYNSTNQTDLAAWQTATGQDGNSSSVPVDFVAPDIGNLHLTGSSIGDVNLAGTPIPGITTDIDKNIRNPTHPYMGAHEPEQPLPVELVSFTSTVNERNVILNWTTSDEFNNQGFDIERRDAVNETNNVWMKVGSVNGNGISSTHHNYSFTDRGLASGKYNYRLKQTDFNGNFEYFNLTNEVNIGVPMKYDLSQNYPNPFNPSTTIYFDLPFDSKVSIKLFDMSGREVSTLINGVETAGYHSVSFNASNLSSGAYFYRITAETPTGNNFVSAKKMVLIR